MFGFCPAWGWSVGLVWVSGFQPELGQALFSNASVFPYEDYRTKRKTDEPWTVLNGDLTPLLPEVESSP